MRKSVIVLFFIIFAFAYANGEKIVISNLNDALRIGIDNNRDLKVKVLEVMSANANLKSAFADLVLPGINGTFRFSTLDPKTLENSVSKISSFKIVTNIVTTPFPMTNIGLQTEEKTITNAFWDNYSIGASITYRIPYLIPIGLDIGFNSYLLQLKNKELSDLQYQKALNDYIYNLKIAYYNYLFAQELAKISIETDKRLEENVRIAEANFNAGIFSDLELIRAKVQLMNNKPNLYSSQNNVRIQKINLLSLLGIDISKIDDVEISGSIEDIKNEFSNITIDFDKERNKIVENNFDLKILRKLIEVAETSKNVSLSANKPTLSLFFNYNYDFKKTNSMDNERVWVDSWNAGLQLSIPISELLPISKSYASMENADYSVEKAKYNYENTFNLILGQFEQIRLKFNESLENIQAQQANVEQAKRSLDIITQRYKFGNASSLDLIDAQLSYQQAEVNLLSAWISYVNNILNVEKLTGEIIEGKNYINIKKD